MPIPKLGNLNSNTNVKTSDTEHSLRTVKVTSIVLDDTHKLFTELGGWNSIGTITFSYLESDTNIVDINSSNVKDNIAIPLNPNFKGYPLIGELVYVIKLPSIPQSGQLGNSMLYYIGSINILNSPNQNSYILSATPTIKFNNVGIPYRNARIAESKLNLGDNFKEDASIRPILPFQGDIILEGRSGNSIRIGGAKSPFTTQYTSENQSNYILISGRLKSESENIHTLENINKDEYILGGFSNHKILYDLPCLNFDSYHIHVRNDLTAPEQLYDTNSIPNSTQSTSSEPIDNTKTETIIYDSPKTESEPKEILNETDVEFETPDYIYVLDESTVIERSTLYNENPEYSITSTNIVPIKYLTLNQLTQILNNTSIANKYLKFVNQTLTLYNINTNRRIAHFLSNCLIESAHFTRFVETGSKEYFSKYGKPGNQLGNKSIEDSYTYRGRGIIQITGRWNYEKMFRDLQFGIVNSPDIVATSPLNIISAGWYWNMRRLNILADADQPGAIRKKIQGTSTDRISDVTKEYYKIIKILSNGTT